MMKCIRCYLAFTRRSCRILLLLGIPLLLLAVSCALWYFTEEQGILWLAVLFVIWPIVAVVGDYFSFGGLYRIREVGLEYVKSSERGVWLVKDAVLGDCVVKFVWTVLLYGAGGILMCLLEGSTTAFFENLREIWFLCVLQMLYGFGIILTGTIISRFFMVFSVAWICGYGAAFLSLVSLFFSMGDPSLAGVLPALLFAVVVTVCNYLILNKKVGEMYYDK